MKEERQGHPACGLWADLISPDGVKVHVWVRVPGEGPAKLRGAMSTLQEGFLKPALERDWRGTQSPLAERMTANGEEEGEREREPERRQVEVSGPRQAAELALPIGRPEALQRSDLIAMTVEGIRRHQADDSVYFRALGRSELGGNWYKFGVTVWPEVVVELAGIVSAAHQGIDLLQIPLGEKFELAKEIGLRAVVLMEGEKASKIVSFYLI